MNGTDFDDLIAFLTVIEQRSFTAAARHLMRDSSSISRRVSSLEERLGIRLLERSTRHVAATEEGLIYYRKMRAAISAMAEADAEVSDSGTVAAGTLRVALPATFGRRWIAPMIPQFLEDWPSISIEAEYSDRYVDLIEERFDIAVRIGDLADSRLMARKLARSERILVAAPAYLNRRGALASPQDLQDHVCLVNSRFQDQTDWQLRRGTETASVRVAGRLVADDSDALLAAAIQGIGIMVCATWLCATERAAGQLVRVLDDWTYGNSGTIQLVRPSARYTPAKTIRFSEWLLRQFSTQPWF